jgi:hypothetical protein
MKIHNLPLLSLKEAINFVELFLINNVLKYFEGSIDFKTAIIHGFVFKLFHNIKMFFASSLFFNSH